MFQVNPLLGRGFTLNIKPYFLRKINLKKLKCRLLQFLFGALRVKVNTGRYFSGEATLSFFFCLPSQLRASFKGKDLLLQEQIICFKSRPLFGRTALSIQTDRKSKKYLPLKK